MEKLELKNWLFQEDRARDCQEIEELCGRVMAVSTHITNSTVETGTNIESDNETVKKHRVLPVTTSVATVVKHHVVAQHGGDTVQVMYWSTTPWIHPVIGTDLGATYSAAAVWDVEIRRSARIA